MDSGSRSTLNLEQGFTNVKLLRAEVNPPVSVELRLLLWMQQHAQVHFEWIPTRVMVVGLIDLPSLKWLRLLSRSHAQSNRTYRILLIFDDRSVFRRERQFS